MMTMMKWAIIIKDDNNNMYHSIYKAETGNNDEATGMIQSEYGWRQEKTTI